MSQLALQGVVFDVDGVLFDTERLTNQTWLAVGKELGWPQIGEYYLEFVGQNRTDIHQKMLDLFGPEFPKEEFMKTCSTRRSTSWPAGHWARIPPRQLLWRTPETGFSPPLRQE